MNNEIIYWMIDWCQENNWPGLLKHLKSRGFTPKEISSACNDLAERAGYTGQLEEADCDIDTYVAPADGQIE